MRTITLRLITAALLLLPQVSQHSAAQRRPLVYRSENTAPAAKPIPLLEMMQLPVRPMLPDPFAWYDGSGRSTDFKDWEAPSPSTASTPNSPTWAPTPPGRGA